MKYSISTETTYRILCDGCSMSTVRWRTAEDAEAEAEAFRFTIADSMDDVVLNFCQECSEGLE